MLTTACSSLAVEKAFANVYFANVQLHTTLSTTTASVGGLWHANVLSAVPNLTQLKTLHLSVSNKDYRQSIMLQRLAACLESLERLSMEGCTLSTGEILGQFVGHLVPLPLIACNVRGTSDMLETTHWIELCSMLCISS